jgi:hypothetical protein
MRAILAVAVDDHSLEGGTRPNIYRTKHLQIGTLLIMRSMFCGLLCRTTIGPGSLSWVLLSRLKALEAVEKVLQTAETNLAAPVGPREAKQAFRTALRSSQLNLRFVPTH